MTLRRGVGPATVTDDAETAAGGAIRRRGRVLLWRAVQAAAVATVVAAVMIARWFVWPSSGPPRRADAVVVLSGDHGERLRAAHKLIAGGYTKILVLAGEPDSEEVRLLCEQGAPHFEVICLRPNPDSTLAEAVATHELARSRGWTSVMVSTTTYHVTRTRLHFGRCGMTDVQVLGARPPYGVRTTVRAVAHEVLGFVYASTVARDCRPA